MMKHEGVCEWCGKPTYSQYKSTLKRFCSRKCSNNWKWANIRKRKEYFEFKCENCGKSIYINKTDRRIKEGQKKWFCDHKCESQYRINKRKTQKCPICGKYFFKQKNITCSSECGYELIKMRNFIKRNNLPCLDYKVFLKTVKEEDKKKKQKNFVFVGREKEYMKEYNKKHKKERNERHKERMNTDEMYNFKVKIRKFIYQSFSRRKESKMFHTEEIVGCSFNELKEHIQSKFKHGMNWTNYGEWQIDHIVPLSSAKTNEDVIKLCHYTNLQPLWASENRLKSNKMPHGS